MKYHIIKNKTADLAVLSIVGRAIRVLAAPITLLIISNKLTTEELAFYYTFFSLVSMQQLAELGLGQVMRQSISHAYEVDENNILTKSSILNVTGYFKLTVVWFACVSFFILIIVGISGYLYLDLTDSNVLWKGPWWTLVVSSSLATLLTPISILLESCQKQRVMFRVNIIVSFIYSITLWAGLLYGLGLYSVSYSIITSTISMLFFIFLPTAEIIKQIKSYWQIVNLKTVFYGVFPYLSRVSIVWACSFFYWNAFGLVSIPLYGAEVAGKLLLAVGLAKAGFDVSKSIVQGQVTLYANMISKNKTFQAKKEFKKYAIISFSILILGYGLFFVVWHWFPDFYVFNKIPSKSIVIQLFMYYVILLIQTNCNNFVRCYKIEPFVPQYVVLAIGVIPAFYISGIYISDYPFLACSLLLLMVVFYNFKKVYSKYIGV